MDRRQLRGRLCLVASSSALVIGLALGLIGRADQQVNQADHNTADLDNNTTQSETSHAVSGTTVVVAWNDSSQIATEGLDGLTTFMGYGYSLDGGATFTDAGAVAPPPGFVNFGDPAVAADGAGNFYVACLLAPTIMDPITHVGVAKSTATSPAVTFGAPVTIPGATPGTSQDKELIAVDTSGGPFDGRVYVAWSEFVTGTTAGITFARATSTSPLVFAPAAALSPATNLNQGVMPTVGPDGEVYVVWGRFTLGANPTQEARVVKSTDGGVTFINPDPGDPSPHKVIASVTPATGNMVSGGVNIRTRGFPYIAVDRTPLGSPTRGRVYVVFQADPDGAGPDRSDVFICRSVDGGVSWSTPRSINRYPAATLGGDPTTNDNWQPAIAVSPTNGHITVTFYDRRDDPANLKIRVYKAVSTDGGITWFNAPVSSVAFTPSTGYDAIASTYMGDYNWATASGGNVHMTWGDCRNQVAPPMGAPNPASPAGRGDQDVFYAKEADLSGPDLLIRPWGYVTGEGPLWKSPDIFVVNSVGTEVNAAKGIVNLLRGRVRNVGNAPASGVIVRFKYAPIFVGLLDSAMKEIGTVSLDLEAAGNPAGNDLKVAAINWDLTDLTDTNGGKWPMPISAFTHFCVRASVEFPGDVNLSNNNAQTNFNDLLTLSGFSIVRFMVGNPFDREVRARIVHEKLPRGFRIELPDQDLAFDKEFPLKAKEIRVVTVRFTPPDNLKEAPPIQDIVAHIALRIGRDDVGGISLRLAKGQKKRTFPKMFAANADDVYRALLEVLKDKKEPVALADPKRRMINTKSIPLSNEQLRQLVDKDSLKAIGRQDGRLLMTLRVKEMEQKRTEASITLLILVNTAVENPLGGQPVPSNGSLEAEHFEALAKKLVKP